MVMDFQTPDNEAVFETPENEQIGVMESVGRGALRNFPFAQQAVAAVEPGKYSENLQGLVSKAEAARAAHPVAYGAGAVAGTAAPMFIPGAGEALGAAPILGNAALNAAQAGSDVNWTKPTGSDIAQTAVGGAIGAGAGLFGKGIKALLPSAEEMGATSAAKGFGTTSRGGVKIAGKDPEAFWNEKGLWANKTKTPDGDLIAGLAKRPGKMLKSIQEVHDAAGEEMGDLLKEAGAVSSLSKASLTKDLYPIADELETMAPRQHSEVMGVINKINKLSDDGKLDLPALNKIKSFVGAESAENPTMSRVYGALSESVNNAMDEYGRILGNPAKRAAFDTARENYKHSSQLLPILRRATGKEMAEGPVGNSGLAGIASLIGGVASGHPVAGAAGALASSVGRPILNMMGNNLALKSVPYAPEIAGIGKGLNKAAQLELANALQERFKKKEQP